MNLTTNKATHAWLLLPVAGLFATADSAAHGGDGDPELGWRPPAVISRPQQPAVVEDKVNLKLEVDGTTLKLFILDAYGEPVPVDIAEAKAFISSAGKTTWFNLRPAGMNMLAGQGDFEPDRDMRVDISLRLPGRKPISRDFYPLRR